MQLTPEVLGDTRCVDVIRKRSLVNIALPYTKGNWGETKPVLIDLKKGSNSFQFTVKSPNKGLSIKKFQLKPAKDQ